MFVINVLTYKLQLYDKTFFSAIYEQFVAYIFEKLG